MNKDNEKLLNPVWLALGIGLGAMIGGGILIIPMFIITMFVGGIDALLIWLLWVLLLGAICIYFDTKKIPKEKRMPTSYVVCKLITGGR
jgi:hypothetical protein